MALSQMTVSLEHGVKTSSEMSPRYLFRKYGRSPRATVSGMLLWGWLGEDLFFTIHLSSGMCGTSGYSLQKDFLTPMGY